MFFMKAPRQGERWSGSLIVELMAHHTEFQTRQGRGRALHPAFSGEIGRKTVAAALAGEDDRVGIRYCLA
jgi:hypothetical protein